MILRISYLKIIDTNESAEILVHLKIFTITEYLAHPFWRLFFPLGDPAIGYDSSFLIGFH